MVKAVGLEQRWLPDVLGGLFVGGVGFKSINYWYKAALEKREYEESNAVNQILKILTKG